MKRVDSWMTTIDGRLLLAAQPQIQMNEASDKADVAFKIHVNAQEQYQVMDGFGASFTDASAYLVHHKLEQGARELLMRLLFDAQEGIGMSMLRQPMGASDFASRLYSYNDLPAGGEDMDLLLFSIEHDRSYILPLLREALRINPQLKIMASPWSPPGWMKTSGQMIGGTLRPECYETYAAYFVKFIVAYEQEGIPIYAVTIQNEPGYEPKEYSGMILKPEEERDFIAHHLGPAFERAGIQTLILCYDHNWDVPEHPLTVLQDPTARRYIAGSAWHCYGGAHEAMSTVRDACPDKGIWFTEASGGAWVPPFREAFLDQMKHVIRSTRNWSKSVVWWNIALDEQNGPTVLSNSTCRGLVGIHQETGEITVHLDYYTMGHISKFVVPGAVRIGSVTYVDAVESVAFRNPDGSTVLIVSNRTPEEQTFEVCTEEGKFIYRLSAEGAITFKW
ncbi:glycoside hydrolase family 30 beta sandwich domain-containing protein [Paenibacillus terrigena]|uniref:glycoside hydrolase family 30 protein n=1 Tax=Paenibacillus terrigena TaxID=369333 RepID=UPI0028D1223F|nr:glycoside hydrolase family 30 beta sandwich domain-containing protein [Paenibacillus terrigena]